MKKFVLAMLLALVSTSAMAEWTKYSWSDQATIYVDLKSIRKNNSLVKMKYLMEFNTTQTLADGTSVMSIVGHYEFDCNDKKRYRQLEAIVYKGSMGTGRIAGNENDSPSGEWLSMSPNTLHESLWKFGCEKK